jgi:cell division protease FtsH
MKKQTYLLSLTILCNSNHIFLHGFGIGLSNSIFKQNKLFLSRSNENQHLDNKRKFPIISPHFVEEIRRLNSKNKTIQNDAILNGEHNNDDDIDDDIPPTFRIFPVLGIKFELDNEDENESTGYFEEDDDTNRRHYVERKKSQSKNFEVIQNHHINFSHVGGCDNIKSELNQCIDILKNYQKYLKYNVRVPKGLMLEGPPGTGKTLIAKALAGEAKCSFISVSGSDFGEKYVGVGSSRIKELFKLAKNNIPCIIFIDEIDALARKRSSDGESSSVERESTLNALLVEMDGFKNNTGIFLVGATNRIDLLDSALMRPGRIDKSIFIGLPDKTSREAILKIHAIGKPRDKKIKFDDLVEMTENLSGAQIENLLNEAMLNALKLNKTYFNQSDLEIVINKIHSGFQEMKHEFTSDMVLLVAIHEMGHAMVSVFSKHHSKASKVVINLSSPKSFGYTVFNKLSDSVLLSREVLFEHLMILLGGRIAEEVFYNVSVTIGAKEDFQAALGVAYDMVVNYGMGSELVYPRNSEKYKQLIDDDVLKLMKNAYKFGKQIISSNKELIYELSLMLQKEKVLKLEDIKQFMREKNDYYTMIHSTVEVPFLELLND